MTYSDGPRLGKDRNPGNAKWCEEHQRLECAKNKSRGRGPCHGPAIRGTDVCRIHPGQTHAVAKAKGEARINAWTALGDPPAGKAIDANRAVMGMLQQSWMRAHLYSDLLRKQVIAEGGDVGNIQIEDAPDKSGLIGFTYGAAGRDGTIYAQSESIRGLVTLESQERDRVVKYAKTAHDMGISERMTGLAEKWGDQVITQIMQVMTGLALTAEQEARVPILIQAHLGQIEITP